jgi:hypothetical protein
MSIPEDFGQCVMLYLGDLAALSYDQRVSLLEADKSAAFDLLELAASCRAHAIKCMLSLLSSPTLFGQPSAAVATANLTQNITRRASRSHNLTWWQEESDMLRVRSSQC